uniref:O antigen flippase n=1 Tax=Aeromonas hydrophila TaxID=644 RepID=A0A346ACM3_AERHY|nr:O antigen flippase [Aeromonas hydrophila]
MLKILSGNGLAQLIQFCGLFLLVRLFNPEEFSSLAIVQSIATIVAVMLSWQLHHVIPLTAEKRKRELVFSSIFMQILLLSIVFIFIALLAKSCELVFGVLLGLLLSYYNLNISYLSSNKCFGYISLVMIARALFTVLLQILFSKVKLEYSIIWAVLLAEVLVQCLFVNNYRDIIFNIKSIKRKLLKIYKERKDFYIYGSFSELVAISAFFLPLYFIDHKFGEIASGNYGMASRLVWAPVVLVSSSICQVLYAKMGDMSRLESITYIRSIRLINVVIVLIFVSLLAFLVQPLYSILLGDKWSIAIKMIPIMVVWGMIFLATSVYRLSYRVFSIQRNLLMIDMLYLICMYLLFIMINSNEIVYLTSIVVTNFIFSVITIILLLAKVGKE